MTGTGPGMWGRGMAGNWRPGGGGFGQGLQRTPGRGIRSGQLGPGQDMLRNWLSRRRGDQQWPNADRLKELRERVQEMRDRFGNRRSSDEPKNDTDKPAPPRPDIRRGPGGMGFGGPDGMMRGRGPRPDGDDDKASPRPGFNRPFGPGRGSLPDPDMIQQWRQRRGAADQDAPGPRGPGAGRITDRAGRGGRGPGARGPSDPDAGDKDSDQ